MKILILGDLHAPSHDRKAVALAKAVAKKVKPELILSVGDWVDFDSISAHARSDVKTTNVKSEVDAAKKIFSEFRALADAAHIVFGNHDFRFERYLATRAPELWGLVTVPELLGLRADEFTPYRSIYRVGKLNATHDVGYSGQNAAAQNLQAFQGNLVGGHTHRAQIIYGGDLRGERYVSMTCGWLGDINAINYMHRAQTKDWTHGVGLAHLTSRGEVDLTFVPFIKGAAIVNGEVVRA